MNKYRIAAKIKNIILALGAESAGNFSVYKNGAIYNSEDFGDLLDENNFEKFQKAVLSFLGKEKIKPDTIITDLHPFYKTTIWGAELAKKHKAKHIQVQHHHAHIFSQIFNSQISSFNKFTNSNLQFPNSFYGIAIDGTGYGLDGRIWGGEVFKARNAKRKAQSENAKLEIERIGHLENQIMIGGELAIREPARMLISILSKFMDNASLYEYTKVFYSRNEFELLYNQLKQNFNCMETSSAGRILDAVSVLLEFAGNKRNYKHEAADLLEKNSSKPYTDLKPKIEILKNELILNTTFLFEYLINNFHKDKKKLAATAQLYIAEGLNDIVRKSKIKNQKSKIYLSGGISNNKIISKYFAKANKKTGDSFETPAVPRGDAGLSFGQIVYYLLGK